MMRQFAGRKALWDAAVDCMAQLDALMSLVGATGKTWRFHLSWRVVGCCGAQLHVLMSLANCDGCLLPLHQPLQGYWLAAVRLAGRMLAVPSRCSHVCLPSAGGGSGLRQRHHVPAQAGALEPCWRVGGRFA